MGPCMCGDICCRSCGPAQGNNRCDVCGRWDSDGGCESPELCREAGLTADQQYAEQMAEWAEIEKQYAAENR